MASYRVAAILFAILPVSAQAQGMPTRLGSCVQTRISALEHRIRSGMNGPFDPNSGSAVRYANGGYQSSFSELPAVHNSRVGDPIQLCLTKLPGPNCHAEGGVNGSIYTAKNRRTGQSWTMIDSPGVCGH